MIGIVFLNCWTFCLVAKLSLVTLVPWNMKDYYLNESDVSCNINRWWPAAWRDQCHNNNFWLLENHAVRLRFSSCQAHSSYNIGYILLLASQGYILLASQGYILLASHKALEVMCVTDSVSHKNNVWLLENHGPKFVSLAVTRLWMVLDC